MKAKIVGIIILAMVVMVGLDIGTGYLGVFKTKTVGKAMKNAEREVYEQSQSYVHAKKQEALKAYKEYQAAKTPEEKQAIRKIVSHSFAEFDENKLEGPLRSFVYDCKYNP